MAIPSPREVFINIVANYEDPERGFNRIQQQMRGLKNEAGTASGALKTVLKDYRNLQKQKLDPQIDLDAIGKFRDQVEETENALRKMSKRKFSIDPSIRAAAAVQADTLEQMRSKLEGHQAALQQMYQDDLHAFSQIEKEKETIANSSDEVRANAESRLQERLAEVNQRGVVRGQVLKDIEAMPREFDKVGNAAEKAAFKAATWGDRMDQIGARVKSFLPLLRGLSILVGVTMVSAIGALAGSLTAAIAGLAGLATSFVAVLAPAFALFTAVLGRLAVVMKTYQARQAALNDDDVSRRTLVQAQNVERLRNAQNRLRDTGEALADAEDNLARANADASDRAKDNADAVTKAVKDLHDAQSDLSTATQTAYDEMADAAEDYRDAILGITDAQLGMRDAKLSLREANLELKKFREEAGLSGKNFDNLFKSFQNVAYDPKALRAAITETKKKGHLDEDQALKLERLLLNVDKAKQNEKHATDDLRHAETNLTRTRRIDQNFQQKGIGASDTYISALGRVDDAEKTLADARKKRSDDEKDNSPIINAQRQLRDARENHTEAIKDQAAVLKTNQDALDKNNQKGKTYLKLRGQLSGAEERFLDSLGKVKDGMLDFVRSGTDHVFSALADIIGQFKSVPEQAATLWDNLGAIFGKNIKLDAVSILSDPAWTDSFKKMTPGIEHISDVMSGQAFVDFLNIIRDLATAYMPHLSDLVDNLAGKLHGLAGKTSGLSSTNDTVKLTVDSFKRWLGFVEAVAGAWVSFSKIAAPFGNEMLGWLTGIVDHWKEWADSKEGQDEIKSFFRDTLPLAKSIAKFIGKLGELFLHAFQFVAPILSDTFEGMNVLLDILNWLADLANKIPTPLRRLLGVVAPLFGVIKGGTSAVTIFGKIKWLSWVGVLGRVSTAIRVLGIAASGGLGSLVDWLGKLPGKLAGAINWDAIGDIPSRIIKTIVGVLQSIGTGGRGSGFATIGVSWMGALIGGFVSALTGIYGLVRGAVASIGRVISSTVGTIGNAGGRLAHTIINGFVSVAGQVVSLGRRFVSWVHQGLSTQVGRVFGFGAAIINGFIAGVTSVSQDLIDAVSGVINSVINVVKRLLDIRSPSHVFQSLGAQTIGGFIRGLMSQKGGLVSTMESLFGKGVWLDAADALYGKGSLLADLIPGKVGKALRGVSKALFGGQFGYDEGLGQTSLPHFGKARLYPINAPQLGASRNLTTALASAGLKAFGEAKRRTRTYLIEEFGRNKLGLASGGVATSPALRMFGEAGKEAVLPLTQSVMGGLAKAIVMEMPRLGAATGGGYGINVENINLPPAPAAQVPDARHQAVQLARELRRRGGGR